MNDMKKFGFWIIPENEVYDELEEIIRSYSKEYNSPIFTPHITLHGTVESTAEEVISNVERATQEIAPFELELGPVEFSSTYFQCVLARVKTTAPLFNAHLKLRKVLNFIPEHVYMPHISLVYGNFDMETREKIAKEIQLHHRKFMAKAITIVKADSDNPQEWDVVKKIEIK